MVHEEAPQVEPCDGGVQFTVGDDLVRLSIDQTNRLVDDIVNTVAEECGRCSGKGVIGDLDCGLCTGLGYT